MPRHCHFIIKIHPQSRLASIDQGWKDGGREPGRQESTLPCGKMGSIITYHYITTKCFTTWQDRLNHNLS